MGAFEASLAFARHCDRSDPLRKYRSMFYIPPVAGKPSVYLCGNSLGLQPRQTKRFVEEELADWAKWGVEGHFHARRPWLHYHTFSKKALARLVGAKPIEVVAMNHLTVNLHLMMISFYQPTAERYKIITEHGAFSSDQYAFESQVQHHGFDPREAIIELQPRAGEHHLRTRDILDAIAQHSSQVALVIFGGVQYYTGQFFNISAITEAGHQAGAFVGFDLAHAIGNVPLSLHKGGVDFAVWCSYKYLNSGPGGIAGAFVHERHAHGALPRLSGWWGHDARNRFKMEKGFSPMTGIDGWQLSNFPVLSGAAHLASLALFDQVGMSALRKKSVRLTGFLEYLLRSLDPEEKHFSIITPRRSAERGCQLSIYTHHNGRQLFEFLTRKGVVADWREPNVIRVAPVPFYNTFEDVFRFSIWLHEGIKRLDRKQGGAPIQKRS